MKYSATTFIGACVFSATISLTTPAVFASPSCTNDYNGMLAEMGKEEGRNIIIRPPNKDSLCIYNIDPSSVRLLSKNKCTANTGLYAYNCGGRFLTEPLSFTWTLNDWGNTITY